MDDVTLVVHRLHHRMSFVLISHLVLGAYLRASRHPLGTPRNGSSLAPLLAVRRRGSAVHTAAFGIAVPRAPSALGGV